MEHTSKLHRTAAPGAGVAPWTGNRLCFGDCLDILEADDAGRPVVADESVDLVYLDPPFNSKADYNMIFGKGVDKQAQMQAFTDTWRWGGRGTLDVEEIKNAVAHPAHAAVSGLHMALGDSGMMAYLGYMAKRLAVIHRKMKPTASVYLHCDPTASHYLKIVMDGIFGAKNFRQEIIWYRYNKIDDKRKVWCKYHDAIFCYSMSPDMTWNQLTVGTGEMVTRKKIKKIGGKIANTDELVTYERQKCLTRSVIDNIPDIAIGSSKQKLGYPTQKPLALLERIIKTSSNPGDFVLDPFCGCGTTIAAAELLDRRWIGIDISAATIRIVTKARKELGEQKNYAVFGIPRGMEEAKKLAETNRLQYENWQISTVPGLAPNNRKNQEGYDGRGTFLEVTGVAEGKSPRRTITAEVKSGQGGVTAAQRNHLKAHVEQNKSAMGIFLTLKHDPATERWCKAQGFYRMPGSVRQYPRFQVYSAEHYFSDILPDIPPMLDPMTGRPVQEEFFARK